jgi:hypothetical protein
VSLFSAGDAAFYAQSQAMWTGLSRFLAYLGWALVAALAGTAVCWGFGYVACGSWTSRTSWRRPPRRTGGWRPDQDLDPATAEEVSRGLDEIEGFLAAAAAQNRPRPAQHRPRTDRDTD